MSRVRYRKIPRGKTAEELLTDFSRRGSSEQLPLLSRWKYILISVGELFKLIDIFKEMINKIIEFH